MGVRRGVVTLWALALCALLTPAGALAGPPAPSFCAQPSLGASAAGEILLGIDRKSVRVGASLRVRIENHSSDTVAWSLPYALDRWSPKKRRWVEVPLDRIFSHPRLSVDAAKASRCQDVEIPAAAAPGRYRVRKVVDIGFPEEEHRKVAATFQVESAPANAARR